MMPKRFHVPTEAELEHFHVVFCHDNSACVEYNLTVVMIYVPLILGMIAFAKLKWNFPLYMIVPYMLGRWIMAVAPSMEIQIFVAGPLIALGYFWAYLSFSKNQVLALATFISIILSEWMLLYATAGHLFAENRLNDLLQLLPWITGAGMSAIRLAMHCQFIWLIGLVWGVCAVAFITDGYKPASFACLPIIFYSEVLISSPLVFIGMMLAGVHGRDKIVSVHLFHATFSSWTEVVRPFERIEHEEFGEITDLEVNLARGEAGPKVNYPLE